MYKISVIVPVYNKENYIEKCLDTLAAQTWVDKGLGALEIVLVDDGSTDASGKMCDEYAVELVRKKENAPDAAEGKLTINVVHKENGGLVSAWKRGIDEASGDYLAFVDCDDWIEPDMMERLAEHATGREDEIVLSDYVIEKDDGTSTNVYQAMEPGEYVGEDISKKVIPVLWGLEDRAVCRSRCMKLFSARLAKENMCYGDERLRFGEDTSLSIPCVLDAGRLYFCNHYAGYHYRYVNDSMVHYYDKNMMASIELVQEMTEKAIKDKADSAGMLAGRTVQDLIALSQKEYIFLLIYAVKNELKAPKSEFIHNIQSICQSPSHSRLIKETDVEVSHISNRLIYMVMKRPGRLNCQLLYLAMRIWEHR